MKPKPRHLWPEYGAQFQDPEVAGRPTANGPPLSAGAIRTSSVQLLPQPSRARVLELGAGTGEIAIPLSAHVASVDAVEVSEAMLAIAATQPDRDRVRWHQQSAESFPYASIYDLIICAQCLAWLDWEIVFPRIAGALDPNGWLVIVSQTALEDLPWHGGFKEIVGRYSTNQHYEPFDLLDELASRGLFELRGRKSTWPVPFSQSIGDYVDSVHARNGFSRDRMAPDAAAAFDAEVRELLLAHHPDGTLRGRNQAHIYWGRPRPPRS